jgi:hypothetical protein
MVRPGGSRQARTPEGRLCTCLQTASHEHLTARGIAAAVDDA